MLCSDMLRYLTLRYVMYTFSQMNYRCSLMICYNILITLYHILLHVIMLCFLMFDSNALH